MKKLQLNSVKDLKKEGKSFYWSSFFLPSHSKTMAGKLYSICRYYDNIADMDKEDKSIFLQDSIKEIRNNKENVVNILHFIYVLPFKENQALIESTVFSKEICNEDWYRKKIYQFLKKITLVNFKKLVTKVV